MNRSRTLALWCVSAVLLLSACGGDDPQPRFAAETSAAAVSASPSPSESVVPEDETPEEFIRRWNDEANRLQSDGEVADYLDMSRGCQTCRDFADRVRDIYAGGGSVETEGWEILDLRPLEQKGRAATYLMDVRASKGSYTERPGAGKIEYKAYTSTYKVYLSRRRSRFNVDDYNQYVG